MERKDLSDSEKEALLAAPAIELPIRFKNGSTVTNLVMICAFCGKGVSRAEHIRGRMFSANRHVVSFEGHVLCHTCKTVSSAKIRFSDDGTMTCVEKGCWVQKKINCEKMGPTTLLKRLLWKSS